MLLLVIEDIAAASLSNRVTTTVRVMRASAAELKLRPVIATAVPPLMYTITHV